jgi:7-cyano-7-deazaguanine synthase in queuosine biosynthesis
LEVFSQFFFGVFVIALFTAKHSSIKNIVMGSKETSEKIFKVNNPLSFEAVTS